MVEDRLALTRGRCECGHAREVHAHYRTGTDCGMCGAQLCARFTATRGAGRLLNLLRRAGGSRVAQRGVSQPPGGTLTPTGGTITPPDAAPAQQPSR